jgi:hypothetical protein
VVVVCVRSSVSGWLDAMTLTREWCEKEKSGENWRKCGIYERGGR